MTSTRLALVVRTTVVSGMLLFGRGVKADDSRPVCKPADLSGNFATSPQGILLEVPPTSPLPAGPFVATGVLTFDGRGGFTGITSSSFRGFILNPFLATGIYTITPDCFVTATETTLNLIFEGYFTKDKEQVAFLQPQPTTITTNTIRRLHVSRCDAGDLRDDWVIQANGSIFDNPAGAEARFAQIGRLKFDGKGTLKGTTTSSIGGNIVDHTVSGTYSVNTNCTFSGRLVDESARELFIFGALYGNGTEFYFDYSAPAPTPATPATPPTFTGLVIAGTGKRVR